MVTTKINLYEFNELGTEEQQSIILEHEEFLNGISYEEDEEPYELDSNKDEDRTIIIENIIANGYLFFKNGKMAQCTTYTGNHEKAGTTELKLNGETYIIKDGTK